MTSVSAASAYNAYSSYYAGSSTGASSKSTSSTTTSSTTTSSTSASATTVTLSASAKAALAAKTFAEVIAEARTTLDDLLDTAGSDSLYEDGKLVIDLSSFDRRSLFAMAGNSDGTFTKDEIKAATDELAARFDAAMAGPAAVFAVTGDLATLYKSALGYLESASSEQKTTDAWKAQHDAVKQALAQLQTAPDTWPDVENDPVVDYLKRVEAGETASNQDFASVADQARAALDAQIADAEAAGTSLTFSKYQKSGVKADLSDFSSRALSAIALNEGEQFSSAEIKAAKDEIAGRARQVLLSCISNANESSDPTALAQNLISAYGSLSDEERQAVGWGGDFYQAALANYKSASYFASLFDDTSSSSTGISSLLGGSTSSSSGSTLLDFLNQASA